MSATFDPRQYLADFVLEAGELLQGFEELLLTAEALARAGRPLDDGLVNKLFRAVHTIKGMAGMLGFSAIVTLAHETEGVFEGVRAGKRRLVAAEIAVLFEVADALQRLLARVNDTGEEAGEDVLPVQAALLALVRGDLAPPPPLDLLDRVDPHDQMATLVDVARGEQLFNVRGQAGWRGKLAAAGRLLGVWDEHARPLEEGDPTPDGPVDFLLITALDLAALLTESGLPVAAVTPAPLPWLQDAAPTDALVLTRKVPAAPTPALAPLTARVEAGQLERIASLTAALARAHAQLAEQLGDHPARAALAEATALGEELAHAAARARLVPVGTLFNRYGRVIRDLGRECGKAVRLEVTGADTLAERASLDVLAEPLVHLLRNAIDHGVETPTDRQAAGKPPEGVITLSGRREGGELVLTVADDGRGIDRAAVLARARTAGLVGPDEEPADEAVWLLITHPGLTTARAVTNVSGRGVGMDAVNAALERLGGSLSIAVRRDQGTRFELRVPMAMA
ncbi:MAG: putative chemotaxis two-component sensor histidine kinase protein [Cyanobacteria bacterium RYN_339]|nr:putative chemotaxis two-component sensor histidine kinase protein [Cyanobacteria bacterium RYN_339]